jgi:hypothetical protein
MAHQIYKVNGKRVPSVTTILSRFKESGGLIEWAYKCGCDGIDIHQVKQEAATAGTLAHAMVEADIRGVAGPLKQNYAKEVWEKALTSFSAYLEWKAQCNLRPTQTELGMVCECHMYGGCMDAVMVGEKNCVLDWKTANGIYADNLCQLAAYGHLWNVNYPMNQIQGFHLVRFAKEDGSFHHHFWTNLDNAWRQFEIFREAYDIDKLLKGSC